MANFCDPFTSRKKPINVNGSRVTCSATIRLVQDFVAKCAVPSQGHSAAARYPRLGIGNEGKHLPCKIDTHGTILAGHC